MYLLPGMPVKWISQICDSEFAQDIRPAAGAAGRVDQKPNPIPNSKPPYRQSSTRSLVIPPAGRNKTSRSVSSENVRIATAVRGQTALPAQVAPSQDEHGDIAQEDHQTNRGQLVKVNDLAAPLIPPLVNWAGTRNRRMGKRPHQGAQDDEQVILCRMPGEFFCCQILRNRCQSVRDEFLG